MSSIPKNQKYEDTIQCFFFSTKKYSTTEWQRQCDLINETITFLSQDYIWHRDEFKVFLPINDDKNDVPPHLMSVTCFGDNIEDEWFIVYLLFELSKTYKDLIIQIEDNDGDFLLIEAADYLPTWANPGTTENRVYIFENNIHILPPSLVSIETSLQLCDALILIANKSDETKAAPDIQQAIIKRIIDYPQKIKENTHKVILNLPVDLAAILKLKPSLVSCFVNAFCSLDSLDVKLFKDIDIGKDNFIPVEIKFTKFLYAMLMHTKFPNCYKFKHFENDKKSQLGFKVLCGYKTLTAKSSKDIYSTSEYQKFLKSLVNNGYFKNNIEGSKEYTRLLDVAKTFFSNMECPISSYVNNIIHEIKLTDEFKSMQNTLKLYNEDTLLEDDDAWLNIQPEKLNEFLNNQYGRKIKIKNNDPVTSHIITSELTNFLKERSDLEGVEDANNEITETDKIDFNSDDFVGCIEKMLTIISNNDIVKDTDLSDFSDDDDNADSLVNEECMELDRELATKLKTCEHNENGDMAVLKNLVQSLKEEGLSGPTSTVLRTIGIEKSDLIDSDDDEDVDE